MTDKHDNTSWCFLFFRWTLGEEQAECQLCGKNIKYCVKDSRGNVKKQTGSLTNHLSGVHQIKKQPTWLQRVQNNNGPIDKFVESISVRNTNTHDAMDSIAEFFVCNGIARRVYDKPTFRTAFPRDIPKGTKRKDLELAIERVAVKSQESVKTILGGGTSAMEIDGGKKAGVDYTNVILSGNFVESFETLESETKTNMIKLLLEKVTECEKEYNTTVSSISNDNCIKIDSAAHEVAQSIGILHARCSPHTMNLTFKDLLLANPILSPLVAKMLKIQKIIMNRRSPRQIFYRKQIGNFVGKGKPHALILKRPGSTRWSAKTAAWGRFLQLIPSVRETLSTLKLTHADVRKLLKQDHKNEMLFNDITEGDLDEDFSVNVTEEAETFDNEISLNVVDRELYEEPESDQDGEDVIEKDIEGLEFAISSLEEEQYHNFYVSVMEPIQIYITKMQNDRWTLLEQYAWMKELRYTLISVEKWDLKCNFMSQLKNKFHKTAQKDIQEIYSQLGKIVDMRSGQFNDKLMCIMEVFLPAPIGVKHTYNDWKEVTNCFLGNISQEGLSQISFIEDLYEIGPKLVHRILLRRDDITTIGDSFETTKKKIFLEYVSWITATNWKGYSNDNDPILFWQAHAVGPYFPTLSILVLELLLLNVANTNVERSFKTQGLILTPLRNRLQKKKFNQELKIRTLSGQKYRSDHRDNRLKKIWTTTEEIIKAYGYEVSVEAAIIEKIDQQAIVVSLAKASRFNRYSETVPSQIDIEKRKKGKKTKIFAMLAKDPSILEKRVISKKKYLPESGDDTDFHDSEDEFVPMEKHPLKRVVKEPVVPMKKKKKNEDDSRSENPREVMKIDDDSFLKEGVKCGWAGCKWKGPLTKNDAMPSSDVKCTTGWACPPCQQQPD